MATSIHHGPPGSFKSFTLVQRFAIDALIEGRVVVTNIRGFYDLNLVKSQFPEVVFPASAEIIFLNGESALGRKLIGGFFHWVPFGSLILIDEGQRVYPVRKDFKLESLDKFICPTGYTPDSLPNGIARPEDIYTAFDMQRHYQWDIFISTTNISKIQKPIREVAETAFFHKSLSGKLPLLFKNTWYEFQHDPENNGKIQSQRIGTPHKYKADERVFKCYQSTATGEHTASKADKNILSDNGVRFKLLIIALSIGTGIYFMFHFSTTHEAIKVPDPAAVPAVQETADVVAQTPKNLDVTTTMYDPGNVPDQQAPNISHHLGYRILQVAFNDAADLKHKRLTFLADSPDGLKVVSYAVLMRSGYTASTHGVCKVYLFDSVGHSQLIGCDSPEINQCAAVVQSTNIISQHNCSKYGKKDAPKPKTNNALMTASTNLLNNQ